MAQKAIPMIVVMHFRCDFKAPSVILQQCRILQRQLQVISWSTVIFWPTCSISRAWFLPKPLIQIFKCKKTHTSTSYFRAPRPCMTQCQDEVEILSGRTLYTYRTVPAENKFTLLGHHSICKSNVGAKHRYCIRTQSRGRMYQAVHPQRPNDEKMHIAQCHVVLCGDISDSLFGESWCQNPLQQLTLQ